MIMDFASGLGGASNYFDSQGCETVRVDPSHEALLNAQNDRVTAKANVPYRLPFESKAFDAIHMKDAITHIDNQFYLLEEFHRLLKPGGLLLITDIDRDNDPYFSYRYKILFFIKRIIYFNFPSDYQDKATSLLHNPFVSLESISPPYYAVSGNGLIKTAELNGLIKINNKKWEPNKDEKDWYKPKIERFIITFRKK
jgi:SAM-dependent methyltransferase